MDTLVNIYEAWVVYGHTKGSQLHRGHRMSKGSQGVIGGYIYEIKEVYGQQWAPM